MRKRTKSRALPTGGLLSGLEAAPGTAADWDVFRDRLDGLVDPGSLARALTMLRAERFQLFADVQPGHALGVIRSQSSKERVYSCRLAADGSFACCTQNLITCILSRRVPCKHLLVLVLGLTRTGGLDPGTALAWLRAAHDSPAVGGIDKDLMAATFLRYKGVEAGEVDWRPTETIPEDFYSV